LIHALCARRPEEEHDEPKVNGLLQNRIAKGSSAIQANLKAIYEQPIVSSIDEHEPLPANGNPALQLNPNALLEHVEGRKVKEDCLNISDAHAEPRPANGQSALQANWKALYAQGRDSPLTGHAVVIRTSGDKSIETNEAALRRTRQLSLVRFYLKQLQGTGIKLAVLNDKGMGNANASAILLSDSSGSRLRHQALHASHASSVSVTRMGTSLTITTDMLFTSDSYGVPVCDVSWDAGRNAYAKSTIDAVQRFGSHSAHDQYLSLWYRHCKTRWNWNDIDYVWFFEDDAHFSGQIVQFIKAYAGDGADLVASGFRIAGPHWWKFSGIPANVLNWGTFNRSQSIVSNVSLLPTMADGEPCRSESSDENGVLFFQDHVLRASNRLLSNLDRVIEDGFIGPSESFIAHFCAHQIGEGFRGDNHCTITDFAPVMLRQTHDSWVSPWWCWKAPRAEVYVSHNKSGPHCTEEFKNKWFHKVERSSSPWDFDCP
jgi:hypothetical protein